MVVSKERTRNPSSIAAPYHHSTLPLLTNYLESHMFIPIILFIGAMGFLANSDSPRTDRHCRRGW